MRVSGTSRLELVQTRAGRRSSASQSPGRAGAPDPRGRGGAGEVRGLGPCAAQPVEERGLAGVGVADQGDARRIARRRPALSRSPRPARRRPSQPSLRVGDDEDAVGDRAREPDARRAHLDDAGFANLAQGQLALACESERAQEIARRRVELGAAKTHDRTCPQGTQRDRHGVRSLGRRRERGSHTLFGHERRHPRPAHRLMATCRVRFPMRILARN